MTYRERSGVQLDISASGRGLQQTLLLLSYIYAHPGSILLLDEPDAHLEILRQRLTYRLLSEVAQEQGSQVIAASHSEVVLNEAADRDTVIAFVGRQPHRLDNRGSQLRKALADIGFDQYYQAEETGWVLYLEGSTDLSILQSFAGRLDHPAAEALAKPFVHYIANQPNKACEHFYGLREAVPALRGIAILDRVDAPEIPCPELSDRRWQRREIENYLCYPEALEAYARASAQEDEPGPLFAASEANRRIEVMQQCIEKLVPPVALRDRNDRWWREVKASDDFLDRVFEDYFATLGLPNLMRKNGYYVLAKHVPLDLIGPEVTGILDAIVAVAGHPSC